MHCAIGVHPNSTLKNTIQQELSLLSFLLEKKCVKAIGEIGLDFHRELISQEEQEERFVLQLELAVKNNLPVVLHQRNSSSRTINILKSVMDSGSNKKYLRGVFHAFNGDKEILNFIIDHDFYLGIGGLITHESSKIWIDLLSEIPLAKFLLETDSPFLSPGKLRGTRNVPQNTSIIATRLAQVLSVTFQEIVENTWRNADVLFSWSK